MFFFKVTKFRMNALILTLVIIISFIHNIQPNTRVNSACGGWNDVSSIDVYAACRIDYQMTCSPNYTLHGYLCYKNNCGGCGPDAPPHHKACMKRKVIYGYERPAMRISGRYSIVIEPTCCSSYLLSGNKCISHSVLNCPDKCGERHESLVVPMILGGTPASVGHLPWQVSLRNDTGHFCGGTLVNNRTVLTAAHCVRNRRFSSYYIFTGDINLRENGNAFGQTHSISHSRLHWGFRSYPWLSSDMALVVLNEPVTLSPFLQPACLPQHPHPYSYVNHTVTISGWGGTLTEEQAGVLQHAEVTVAPSAVCQEKYQLQYMRSRDFQTIMCVGGQGQASICGGDSGSGLFYLRPDSQTYTVIGVASFAGQTCSVGEPVGYANVTHLLAWVRDNLA